MQLLTWRALLYLMAQMWYFTKKMVLCGIRSDVITGMDELKPLQLLLIFFPGLYYPFVVGAVIYQNLILFVDDCCTQSTNKTVIGQHNLFLLVCLCCSDKKNSVELCSFFFFPPKKEKRKRNDKRDRAILNNKKMGKRRRRKEMVQETRRHSHCCIALHETPTYLASAILRSGLT